MWVTGCPATSMPGLKARLLPYKFGFKYASDQKPVEKASREMSF